MPVKPGDLVVDLNVSEETSNGSGDLVVKLRQLDADEKCSVILGKATHIARHFPFDWISGLKRACSAPFLTLWYKRIAAWISGQSV